VAWLEGIIDESAVHRSLSDLAEVMVEAIMQLAYREPGLPGAESPPRGYKEFGIGHHRLRFPWRARVELRFRP
jgi:hypothetical protein